MSMGEDSEKKNPPGNSKEGNTPEGGCVFRARSPISVNAGSHILGWILICEDGV